MILAVHNRQRRSAFTAGDGTWRHCDSCVGNRLLTHGQRTSCISDVVIGGHVGSSLHYLGVARRHGAGLSTIGVAGRQCHGRYSMSVYQARGGYLPGTIVDRIAIGNALCLGRDGGSLFSNLKRLRQFTLVQTLHGDGHSGSSHIDVVAISHIVVGTIRQRYIASARSKHHSGHWLLLRVGILIASCNTANRTVTTGDIDLIYLKERFQFDDQTACRHRKRAGAVGSDVGYFEVIVVDVDRPASPASLCTGRIVVDLTDHFLRHIMTGFNHVTRQLQFYGCARCGRIGCATACGPVGNGQRTIGRSENLDVTGHCCHCDASQQHHEGCYFLYVVSHNFHSSLLI